MSKIFYGAKSTRVIFFIILSIHSDQQKKMCVDGSGEPKETHETRDIYLNYVLGICHKYGKVVLFSHQ